LWRPQGAIASRIAPAGARGLAECASLFRPALLQPDFRTQKSSRWRLTQALVKPETDSPGLRVECARPIGFAMLGGNRAAKSPSNVQEGGSDGVCPGRSHRNDAFFCDLEALVPSHPIGCIVEKTGAVLHCIKCT
jgi:hypothetical protein